MKAIPGPYTMITLGELDRTHIEYHFDTKAAIIPLVSSTGHGHASMKRVKYCEGKFALGNILCAIIPKDENFVLAKYLHIYLHWNREELLVSQMKGMANVSLPMNRIADVMVTVPSIEKQKEIIQLEKKLVEKELEADKLFADQLTQLENLNQAILQEAVQGKLVAQDPKDELASELLKRIKEEKALSGKKEKMLPTIKPEEIPFEIPESWVWCRLGEISGIKGGKRVRNGYKLLKTPTEHIYIRVTDMKNGSVSNNDIHYIDEKMFEAIKQYTISKNDLYITIAGTIGEVGEVPEMFDGANLTENAAKFVFNNELISRSWLKNILISKHSQLQFLDKTKKVTAQPKLALTRIATTLIPFPPLSEQKRIVAKIEKQLTKTKQLKEHIIANQQATEQLLKALLHQAFEVEEIGKSVEKEKVIKLDTNLVNWDKLVAEPFESYAAHPTNNIQDINWEMAMMVACMKNKLGVTYGDVGLQKNVYNTNNIQPIFSKQYAFANSNFGTYCHELKEDLKRNPYLTTQKVSNNKEVYTVNPEYNKQVLDKISAPENKEFVQALNRMLSLYEHPFINKETDKIELYNSVLKIALDKSTVDINSIYQGMKDWKINQAKYKTKAEKFTKSDAEKMLKLLVDEKILKQEKQSILNVL
ncbi:Type I restriction-modification system, specificity subunit S [Sphingobacterium faecium PCAi_F2.5]|nr:Type I restriction-modification system, specificity subunit S [Sphingobacterium faecium PCAi_F2.5]